MSGRSVTLEEYLRCVPDDEAWARKATSRYRALTPAERLEELSALNAWMDAILAGREPVREDGELPFWRLWKDPVRGRAR